MPRRITPFAFLAVPLAVLFVFTLLPTVAGLALSVFSWDGGGTPRFVGLDNFRALWADPKFRPALINTIVFVVLTVPLTTALGFGLAVLVNARWFVGKAAARTMLFLPTIVSIIAIGFLWRWLLEDNGGLVVHLLRMMGVQKPPSFLSGGSLLSLMVRGESINILSWPMLSICLVQVWRGVGFCMVLYLAALQSISQSLYEAAEVDGASRWLALRHITLPQVGPTTAFLLVTGIIGALQVFDIVYALTSAAETDATNVLNLFIYNEFKQSRFGYAAAIGVVIFGVTVVVTLLHLMVTRRRER